MEVIYGLIPGMIVMGLLAVAVLFWAVRSGQFDDLEGDAQRILMDDGDMPLKKPSTTPEADVSEPNDLNRSTDMSQSIKGSQTEKNLLTAFAGESQARNRYTYFAGAAKKEGLVQISHIFEETANQEKEHAKRFFNFLEGGEVEITESFPAGQIGTTLENLRAAAAGEEHEWAEMYPAFAKVAREEGLAQIAEAFEAIAIAEKQHGKRYQALADNLEAGKVFKRAGAVVWRCRNCGYLHEADMAPDLCPACLHLQAHFELLGENW
ncbi:Rubrerythrin [hydrothermal vent metagenome]|uniref:Rubrerythrin n=1 Tax=hydrothermal vent metagenome TaxID=652676 RepID=A0A3B1BBB8_9ZZZZ